METGAPLGLKPGHISTIRRIEGAMLSYHADADIPTNPYELAAPCRSDLGRVWGGKGTGGLERQCR